MVTGLGESFRDSHGGGEGADDTFPSALSDAAFLVKYNDIEHVFMGLRTVCVFGGVPFQISF